MTEIFNLSTLCRCCHADGYFKSLSVSYQDGNDVEIYEIMLRETLGIAISTPLIEASYTICDECILKLRDATDFKKQVLLCEQKFVVYCNNEQFLISPDTVKVEVDVDGDECFEQDDNTYHDDDQIDDKDPEAITHDQESVHIKTEYSMEVDIKHPIEELKNEDEEKDLKDIIIKKKPLRNRSNCDDVKKDEDKDSKKDIIKKRPPRNRSSNNDVKKDEEKDSKKGIIKKRPPRNRSNNNDVKKEPLIEQIETDKGIQYSCKSCNSVYSNKIDILKHIRLVHTVFRCEHSPERCQKTFASKRLLSAHLKTHSVERFICDLCQKCFKYKQSLKKHFQWHAGTNKSHLCDICGHSFNDKSNLRTHITVVHEKKRLFKCNICFKSYTAKKHLKRHLDVHFLENGEPKRYQCEICKKRYADAKSCEMHALTHENKFMCKYCRNIFDDKEIYLKHLKEHHRQSESHPCKMCGKNLQSKYSLNRHMDNHSGIKKFGCDICNVKFSQKALLTRHNLRRHNPDAALNINTEKVKCTICKRFVLNIRSHMNSHNDRKFACDLCGRTYAENNALTRHKWQSHYGRTFDCDVCGKKYGQKAKMLTHKLKVHTLKVEKGTKIHRVRNRKKQNGGETIPEDSNPYVF